MRAAAAQIAAHPLLHLRARQRHRAAQIGGDMARHAPPGLRRHPDRRADLPRRAITALETVMFDERGLQRMQRIAVRQPLDRRDLAPIVLHRQREARQDTLAIDQHRARAARSLVAALLGAGQVQMLAEMIQQRHARIAGRVHRQAIDDDRHPTLHLQTETQDNNHFARRKPCARRSSLHADEHRRRDPHHLRRPSHDAIAPDRQPRDIA